MRNHALESEELLGQRVGDARDWLRNTQLPIADTCKANTGVPKLLNITEIQHRKEKFKLFTLGLIIFSCIYEH